MSAEVEGRAAAERFREAHRLGGQPLGDLVALIEHSAGLDVAVLDVGPDEHGLTMRDPKRGAVFIGVARTRHPMRQRSTLAHELAHVVFGDWADNTTCDWSAPSPTESRANAFARHLLVPVDGLKALLAGTHQINLATLSAVVQWFLVSPQIAAIALEQAEYIDADTKRDWMSVTAPQLAVRFGWGDQYRMLQSETDQRRAPQRLLARAIRGYTEGVVSAQTIATLQGITAAQVLAELREAGIFPAQQAVTWADPDELPDARVDLSALEDALRVPEDAHEAASELDAG
ncbi:ImmA/IrrE family metallo-endopeptidase [Dactylosporangium aurantiacum]|uniref:ImmA/IrrE family metallo-endopeptidase n=1 Tax=Dactylosporangium aurantiacum TaxID=35754 RepID=A0A9Q9ID54_9ACTN|nr:ImmA/IrrE family metallo-endopeptidase [Dactylosporangium aurantiacum]MDG6108153.1 ImmA/IrrE family metallo-endopeptidase [Dactylosporangium aurantiacum]UWZ53852.1 ImmA/IrrE family metallo-endopeptidase [Dactylosporangium aurantiacum]